MVGRNPQRWKSGPRLRPWREDELSQLGRRLDWLVAQVTKYRDGWKCQRCGKQLFAREAHCAHVLPKRAGILLRWDRHNTIPLCAQETLTHARDDWPTWGGDVPKFDQIIATLKALEDEIKGRRTIGNQEATINTLGT